eukprot:GHUV01016327.1.p1 GENE.GHUV01016327.1~~GHUV01016327.1.p1  ORF type:complete len:470 (+),score=128.07 GHUV01016327.1:350-1759(+)
MCPTNGTDSPNVADIHATGQPDTPIEVITDLMQKALQQSSLEGQKQLVQQALDVAGGLDAYLEKATSPPPKVVSELVQASLKHDWTAAHKQGKTIYLQKKECCAGTLEGRFLKMLVAITGAKHVLEVGMFTGTTSLAMAEALPQDGTLIPLDIEPYMAEFAAPFFQRAGLADRIKPMIGPAQESMVKLGQQGTSFDLIFLDANKDDYASYYQTIMEQHLLAPGGLLVVDNSLMKGRVYAPGNVPDSSADAVRSFNEMVLQDPRVEVVVVPFRDGVSLVRRRPAAEVAAAATSNGTRGAAAPASSSSSNAASDSVLSGFKGNTVLQRFKLTGKTALITGAGQGIGRAWAHALGEAGCAIAVVDMDLQKAQQVCHELDCKGVKAVPIQADVSKKADCERMVKDAVSALGGRLDIAINNAGINRNSAAEDTPENEWDMTFAVNTKGVFLCCQVGACNQLHDCYAVCGVFLPS